MNMIGSLNSHDSIMSKTNFDCAHIEKIAKASAIELTPELKEQLRSDLQRVEDVLHIPWQQSKCVRPKKRISESAITLTLLLISTYRATISTLAAAGSTTTTAQGYFTVPKVLNNDT